MLYIEQQQMLTGNLKKDDVVDESKCVSFVACYGSGNKNVGKIYSSI